MSTGRPDVERRLIPRWRSSREAVNAGELRSTQLKKHVSTPTLEVPQFDALKDEWNESKSSELAAEIVSSAITLGRSNERPVQEAAQYLIEDNTTTDLRAIAHRIVDGKLGIVANPTPFSFDPDVARAELRSQIAVHKRRVRVYPKNALAWTDLARLYTAMGQQDKAKAAIRVATALGPNNRFVLRAAARFFVHSDGKHREDHIQEGLHYLRKSHLMRDDPWIMAAEISLSSILEETPNSLKWARQLADEDSMDPWDSSELNGALATLAIQRGGIGKPGKLFNKSLRAPTENALAQAQWASDKHKVIQVSERTFEGIQTPAFEALALKHRAERKWDQVIVDCRAWSAMEPTSTRPLVLGAFVAEAALENGEIAREFSERALLIAPNESWAHNNLAVALAYLGRLDEASAHASRYQVHELAEDSVPVYFATQGLLAYRRGQRNEGLHLYLKAARTEAAQKDAGLRALILWHLLREEAKLRTSDTQELADLLWKQTQSLGLPELEALNISVRNPKRSTSARAMQLLRSLVGQSGVVPSIKESVAEDIRKFF